MTLVAKPLCICSEIITAHFLLLLNKSNLKNFAVQLNYISLNLQQFENFFWLEITEIFAKKSKHLRARGSNTFQLLCLIVFDFLLSYLLQHISQLTTIYSQHYERSISNWG